MTILNFCGAESGDFSEAAPYSDAGYGGTISVQSGTKRKGGYAWRVNPATTALGWVRLGGHDAAGDSANLNVATGYFTFWLCVATKPAANFEEICDVLDTVNARKFRIYLKSDGKVMAYNGGNTTLLGTSTAALTADGATWYRIDVTVGTGATAAYEVKIDGTSEISGTSNLGANNNGYMALGKTVNFYGQSVDWYFDDWMADDSAYPSTLSTSPNDMQVVRMDVSGAGNYSEWTTGTYADVDEIPHDSDGTYIADATNTHRFTAALEAAASAGVAGTPLAVKACAIGRDEGNASARLALRLRSGSTDDDTSSSRPGSSYILKAKVYLVDPNGGGALSGAVLDAMEVGLVNSASYAVRCTAVFLTVLDDGVNLSQSLVPDPVAIPLVIPTPILTATDIVSELTLEWSIAPSLARIDDALAGRRGPVVYGFRFEKRTIGNVFLADITPAVLDCSWDQNNDRDILCKAKLTVDPALLGSVTLDPLADHVAVFMDLLVDSSYPWPIQMGLLTLTEPDKTFSPNTELWEIQANDITIHLIDAKTTTPYTVAAGENYIDGANAVKDILNALGLRFSLPITAKTLTADKTWPPATPWLTIVNWLLSGLSMYGIAPDETGLFQTRAQDDLKARTPDVVYTENDFVLIPVKEQADMTRFANQVIAYIDDPSRPILSSVQTNADPDSPISTINLGRTIAKPIKADSAADQTTLDEIAKRELARSASLYRRAQFLTPIDPRIFAKAHQVFGLTVTGLYAVESWWSRNFTVRLRPGEKMQHAIAHVESAVAS